MRFFATIIIVFVVISVKAQQQSYFHFDRITEREGLPSNNTKKIIQDKQGFIWIGTSEGLCLYDGYHITTFTHNPSQPHSLVNNFIYDLSEDENGNIWIATAGGWCELLYNSQTFLNENDFKNFHGNLPHFFVEFIHADHFHHIIMGGYTGSCFLNLKDSSFNQFQFSKQDTTKPGGLNAIYQDNEKLVWLEFQNCMCVYDPAKNVLYSPLYNPHSYPLIKYTLPLLRQGNTFWLGRWSLYIYEHNIQTNVEKIVGRDTSGIRGLADDTEPVKMIVDNDGNFWVLLFEKGVYYMNFKHNNFRIIEHQPNDYNSIPSPLVRDILKDHDGNIWITTDNGVARWNNNPENFLLLPYGIDLAKKFRSQARDNYEVDDVMETDNDMWLSVSSVGLLVIKKNNPSDCRLIQTATGKKISGMNRLIHYIFKDKNQNIWISTQEGYAKYDGAHDWLIPHFLSRQDITGNNAYQVQMMLQDKEGIIWVASKKGIGKLDPATDSVTWISLPAKHETDVPYYIFKMREQNDSVLWLATDGGLFSFNKKSNQFKRYSSENRGALWKPFDDCLDVAVLSDTAIMIASQFEGLIQFNPQTEHFKIYTTIDGLPSNNIRQLYADNFGALWITTLNGVSRLNLKTKQFSNFDYSNGLKDLNFPNDVCFVPEKDGNILLLDGGYILRFNPAQFVQQNNIPKITFTSFEKYGTPVFYNKPLNEMKKINLHYSERYFTIRFSTLSFQNTTRTRYEYKMKGLDNTWHLTKNPFVSYSNLSGGNYTLFVKASLDGNEWSKENEISFYVTPPFWQAWWFYLICAVVIVSLFYGFYRIRIKQLQHEMYLRTKISRDLHDDVGSTLSSLHIVSALAQKKMDDDPEKTKELLGRIIESSERMTSNMQDIVWAVNPLNDSFSDIIARMQKFASQILESKNIELFFDADEEIKSIKLSLKYRGDLYMIFKEAVNNIAKYSNAKHAWITLYKNNNLFTLELKDDGIGFDANIVQKGNGLRNMRERANNLDGKLSLSDINNGTIIHLEFT